MTRPVDWYVLDLSRDPTPGDPWQVRSLARRVQRVSDDAERAARDVRGLASDGSVLSWLGLAGEVFRGALDDFPSQLDKLAQSYGQCSSALTAFAGELDGAQDSADRALEQGRQARAEIASLQSQLGSARDASSSAASAVAGLNRPVVAGAEPPDPDQVRAATRNAQAAASRVSALSGALSGAQGRLEAAKRLARDAEDLRNDAGDRAKARLHDASDAGIKPNSWWEDFKSGAAKVWRVTIEVAKVLVAVLGIVVLIIGGPLAWVVVGLSVLILADALMKVRNGEGGWLDVAVAALGLIPGVKGLTTLGALKGVFRSGGTLAALAHVGSAGRQVVANGVRGAQSVWQGRRALPVLIRQLPFTARGRIADMAAELRHGVPGATRAFTVGLSGGGSVAGRVRTAFAEVGPGFRDARAVFRADPVATGDAAYAARGWQRGSGGAYPGIDPWRNATPLQAGDRIEGLYPGTRGFVFPAGHMDDLGLDGRRVAESAQVGPSQPNGDTILNPYRDTGVRFEATTEVPRAVSRAQANMQYGAGGAPQMFIPDFGDLVHRGDIIAVAADGSAIPTFVDKGGSVWIRDVDGGVVRLDGVGDVSPGVWDPRRFGTDRDSVLQGVRPLFDAGTLAVGVVTKPVRLHGETVGR